MVEVVPTILVKSQREFKKRLRLVESLVDRVQWDIMDGDFVENVTFSDTSVLNELDPPPTIEADLMVSDPQNWIERFGKTNVDRLIFHIESTSEPEVLIQDARAAGFKVGLAIDPPTPLKQVQGYLDVIDLFQAMGGRSGWGGQEFNPSVLDRIAEVRWQFPDLNISVDIGVSAETAPKMVAAGANILCAGSYIFNSDNIGEAIEILRNADA